MLRLLLAREAHGLCLAAALDAESALHVPDVLIVAVRSSLGSALNVVFPVPERPKKMDTSLSGPIFAEACNGSSWSAGGSRMIERRNRAVVDARHAVLHVLVDLRRAIPRVLKDCLHQCAFVDTTPTTGLAICLQR